MHIQRQQWVTDKINPSKIEKKGIGKDKLHWHCEGLVCIMIDEDDR